MTARPAQIIHAANFAEDAALLILTHARAAIEVRGVFRLALAGGNTPRVVYRQLARLTTEGTEQETDACGANRRASPRHAFQWDRVQLTFSDERCVPAEHELSNYRMARESLLDDIAIPAGNVFRIRGEIDPTAAANEYESQLAAVARRFGETRYVHDLVLLGLGEDGHTASLFPGSPALSESVRNLRSVTAPKEPPQRVTFTLPLINAAREVCFLVSEPSKRGIVEEVLAGDPRYPASAVKLATWVLGF